MPLMKVVCCERSVREEVFSVVVVLDLNLTVVKRA
jgi:hypothetical protein